MSSSPVDQYKAMALKYVDQFDSILLRNDYVRAGHDVISTKVPQARPSYVVSGLGLFVFLFLVWGVGAKFVANLVGFVYPLYESFRSLNDGQADDRDSQWLTYWIVYGLFTLVESFTDFLSHWIPFYHLVKIAFLMWCFLPNTQGALVIYRTVIEPLLVRYESQIDAGTAKGRAVANRVAKDVEEEVSEEMSTMNKRMVNNALGNLTAQNAAPTSGHGGAPVESAPAPAAPSSTSHVEHGEQHSEPKKDM